jgi:hypothetical protein
MVQNDLIIGVDVQNFTRRHINALVHFTDKEGSWKLTCFYEHSVADKRQESWDLLEHLKFYALRPWLCLGDFNEITSQEENEGGAVRQERQMQSFRDVLESCNLHDLGYDGAKFTWTNCRYDGEFIKERLDRAVANSYWSTIFREVSVNVLAARSSNHKPIWVKYAVCGGEQAIYHRQFKFEAKWHLDKEYNTVLEEAWSHEEHGGTALQVVQGKLDHYQRVLSRWSGKKFGSSNKLLKKKTKLLEELQSHEKPEVWDEIMTLKKEIEFILE